MEFGKLPKSIQPICICYYSTHLFGCSNRGVRKPFSHFYALQKMSARFCCRFARIAFTQTANEPPAHSANVKTKRATEHETTSRAHTRPKPICRRNFVHIAGSERRAAAVHSVSEQLHRHCECMLFGSFSSELLIARRSQLQTRGTRRSAIVYHNLDLFSLIRTVSLVRARKLAYTTYTASGSARRMLCFVYAFPTAWARSLNESEFMTCTQLAN